MSDLLKAVRTADRAGQLVLRRRGKFHGRRGYVRPRKVWSEDA